jgi:7,8-dihydropterin-6-yl-methyl-4-(beta-D-ribofuranosyl)aminobenzene 5'-phosphate synthase
MTTMRGLDRRLSDLGEVESVSILPVVERLTRGPGLRGEPGVSYLIRADDLTLLFDCGLGTGTDQSVLDANAHTLGVSFDALGCIVISHLHADHVGGPRSQFRHTFSPGAQTVPGAVPAYVPTDMTHSRADVCVVEEARIIGRGVAVLPPLARMLFWPGLIAEQALIVNVRGRGLILVSGCGHPAIESVLAAAERIVEAPIYGVIGGLHLPVHGMTSGFIPQAVLGNPNWPWRLINEADAEKVIASISERGPGLVALSGHDSTPWTMTAFGDAFGGRFQPLRVGEEILIRAA